MKRAALALALLLAGCSSCGGGVGSDAPPPLPTESVVTPPPAFAARTSTVPDDPATIAQGRALFLANCTTCHGPNADGKGPAAPGLNPPPANFLDGIRLASHDDSYLFWRLTVGKKPTAMPAFGSTLSEQERWTIIRYLRSLPNARRSGS